MITDQTSIHAASPKERVRLEALRSVALIEFIKGAIVLAAAISLYWLDPSDVTEAFLNLRACFSRLPTG